jgi:hypothetical protein
MLTHFVPAFRTPLLAILVLSGCSCGSAEGGETEATTATDGLPMGTIEGIIRLSADSELPRYGTNPMAATSEGTPIPDDCSPARERDASPLVMSDDRGLSFVPVMGLGDRAHWPERAGPRSIDVHIRDCRLDPPVVTATAGDVLRVHNDLMYPFFPSLGSGGFFQAVLPGEAREFELDLPRPVTLGCSVTSPCGRTEVLVLGSPVHTLSVEGGHFTLEVPADQDIELVAWHPLIAEAAMHTTVGAGETVHVEIEVHAVAVEAPPAPLPIPEGDRVEDHPELGPF